MLGLLLHGSRINEWAQATPDQVFEEDGVFGLRVSGQVKTKSSRRRFPLHRTILELGFLDYVRQCRTERLFPNLTETEPGQFAAALSKTCNKLIDAAGVCDRRKVVHSFRHTWMTKGRRARIAEEDREKIAGHEGGGQNRKYGDYPLAPLKAEIDRIDFPLDLAHLARVRDKLSGASAPLAQAIQRAANPPPRSQLRLQRGRTDASDRPAGSIPADQ
jgi:integrase